MLFCFFFSKYEKYETKVHHVQNNIGKDSNSSDYVSHCKDIFTLYFSVFIYSVLVISFSPSFFLFIFSFPFSTFLTVSHTFFFIFRRSLCNFFLYFSFLSLNVLLHFPLSFFRFSSVNFIFV